MLQKLALQAIKEMRQSVQGKIEAEVQKQLTLRQVGQLSALSLKMQREYKGAPQAATNPSTGQAAPGPSPAVPVSTAPSVPLVSEAMPLPTSAAPPATTGTTRQLGSGNAVVFLSSDPANCSHEVVDTHAQSSWPPLWLHTPPVPSRPPSHPQLPDQRRPRRPQLPGRHQ